MATFRDYSECEENIRKTYYDMHKHQTVEFVISKHNQWLKFQKQKHTLIEALDILNNIIDQSDPDTSHPNIIHAYQTAEGVRKEFPELDWLHLTGLIHDLGKLMILYGEPQWAVVGDTFPVGCKFSEDIIFGAKSFTENPDSLNPHYNTKFGIYEPNCGLSNVIMSWGHDEYMYQMLKYNKNSLPQVALNIIRFHSFYPWHTAGQYMYLCDKEDIDVTLPLVKTFNRFDLYSKSDKPEDLPDIEQLEPYYRKVIAKYFGDDEIKLYF